ncbi:ferritin heavy chain B-like [Heterodontus francisci]|uniref:ferritin heavy chain B-like n=1 Tax=Heterodontus francisci TaxID=7792 RepID=UPI00355C83CB
MKQYGTNAGCSSSINTRACVGSSWIVVIGTGLLLVVKIMMASQVCQNYHKDCEDAVNKQINLELYSSYVYLSMSYYFDRDDVSLRHFAEFFKEQSHEEREHAEKLMKFQNKRGGRIILENIKKPEQDEWSNGLETMQRALQMEKDVNQSLLDLHKLSTGNTDPHTPAIMLTNSESENRFTLRKLKEANIKYITDKILLKRLGKMEAHGIAGNLYMWS